MTLINGYDLARLYGPREIFSGVRLSVPPKARIALVGPNGAGKTSLLRILAGLEAPDRGTLETARDVRIGFLEQHAAQSLPSEATLWAAAVQAFAPLIAEEEALSALAARLAAEPDLLTAYGEAQTRFEQAGGYAYAVRTRQVLSGLGFSEGEHSRLVHQLSGGQKTRAALARLLLEAPDLLILDEPTNHLDIYAIEWLENYLREFEGALLVVSHDRYFLDKIANITWELAFGRLEAYSGGYSQYVTLRAERHAALAAEYERQQSYISDTQDFIRRNIAGQNTRQAQGRRKRLERFLQQEALARPDADQQAMRLNLQAAVRSGDKVIEVNDGLRVGYAGHKPLFEVPPLLLKRGECAAVIGPNGAGKSTFLKTLLGQVQPLSGQARLGAGVQIGYFAQAHEGLEADKTVLDELLKNQPDMAISAARDYLAAYRFTGDDVFKPVGALSGGERGRLALAKLSLGGANLLLLDEPSNHLDIPSQERLEDVLDGFEGTILLVSHDRYLIRTLASQVWAVQPGQGDQPGRLEVFEGPYEDFLARSAAPERPAAPSSQPSAARQQPQTTAPKLNPYLRQKRIAALEAEIHSQEAHLGSLSAQIEAASLAGDAAEVGRLGEAYAAAEAALDAVMQEWDALLSEA